MCRGCQVQYIVVVELMMVKGMMSGLISFILGCAQRDAYGGGEWRCNAKPMTWPSPVRYTGASIAVCILRPLAFRLRCLEVLFCGFGYVAL